MLYTKRDVDFVAVYVIPEESWFIIPVERVHHKALDLPPRDAASRSQWEQYREAWHLLGARPGLTLHAAAADASNAVEWPDERVSAAPCEVFIVSS